MEGEEPVKKWSNKNGIAEKVVRYFASSRKWPKWQRTVMYMILFWCVILVIPAIIPIFIGTCFLKVFICTLKYYKSDEFLDIKQRLAKKIVEYNEFDGFMDETRAYIRTQQGKLTSYNVRPSTLTVYKNAQLDPFKYIVKYFFNDKHITEESLQTIEQILQKYSTIEQTYSILSDEYEALVRFMSKYMYPGAYAFPGMTMKRLGSRPLPKFVRDYYMWYAFTYTSPTNRNGYNYKIVLDEPNLQRFAQYLNAQIKYRKSAKYQRQLMTKVLREGILARDNYTCKICGVSRHDERHLLLEVDHIVPISKGGITIEDNLQTLCWKCNRSKGAKIA